MLRTGAEVRNARCTHRWHCAATSPTYDPHFCSATRCAFAAIRFDIFSFESTVDEPTLAVDFIR